MDEIARLRAAMEALAGEPNSTQCGKPGMPMTSEATRAKMADAQKARWAKSSVVG
jgi:hypothetical protein